MKNSWSLSRGETARFREKFVITVIKWHTENQEIRRQRRQRLYLCNKQVSTLYWLPYILLSGNSSLVFLLLLFYWKGRRFRQVRAWSSTNDNRTWTWFFPSHTDPLQGHTGKNIDTINHVWRPVLLMKMEYTSVQKCLNVNIMVRA